MAAPADVIDHLAGIAAGSPLDAIRAERPQARENAQASYDALFAPSELDHMSQDERYALAAFVALLHGNARIAAYYAEGLPPDLAAAVASEAARGATEGPYGDYPSAALATENLAGPDFQAGAPDLSPRLAAAMTHAHMLVFHPRDAAAPALQALLDAGWSTTGIVTLSQLVAFLAFQIRTIEGLRVMAAMG
jgi:CMD domain protein